MLNIASRLDLEKLIQDKLPENLTLDYKASPALNKTSHGRSELVKDITAFANSAGGQIVYGVVEKDGMPISLDSGVNINDYSPEWIAQVLDTNSSPRVQNIEAKTISADDSTKNYAHYVISIPPATTFAPHQNVFDKKYYRRFDRRSVPMHDYEIRDLLRRGNFPELVVRFKLDGTKSPPSTPMDGRALCDCRRARKFIIRTCTILNF
jgi:predicted HTH transcriptional regulator